MLRRLPKNYQKILFITVGIIFLVIFLLILVVQVYLEPTLKKRIHTLIITGSDSLYNYKLGSLHADLLGGSVELRDLAINVDSNRYFHLQQKKALPSLTVDVNLKRGYIKGVGVLSILFSKKIRVEEIATSEADLIFSRHVQERTPDRQNIPLWRSMQPTVRSISIDKIKLDGVKLLYRNADTSESVKLQFDRFDAVFNDIKVDSASAADTTRLGIVKSMFLKFHDLKFRSADSMYKMKAEWITYSSDERLIVIDSFKLQPTLAKEDFYEQTGISKSLYYVQFDKIRLVNAPLERYLHQNMLDADSIIIDKPELSIYLDKTKEGEFRSRMGSYPHQLLSRSVVSIHIKNILLNKASVLYTEKGESSGEEGNLPLNNLDIHIKNATNRMSVIGTNDLCTVEAKGNILGESSIQVNFKFYLDSLNGRFDVSGMIENITGPQLNKISIPLANMEIPSARIHKINFSIRADDLNAYSDVDMHYNNLSMIIRKRDEKTGAVSTRKFLTRAFNRFAIHNHNPQDGVDRKARDVLAMRLNTQSFFGLIWKSLFAGMQSVMMRSGSI
jgi:hypothetical protein